MSGPVHPVVLIACLRTLLGLNVSTCRDSMVISFPVWGLRPRRAVFDLTSKLPNLAILMVSPLSKVAFRVLKKHSTASPASFFVIPVEFWIRSTISAFVTALLPTLSDNSKHLTGAHHRARFGDEQVYLEAPLETGVLARQVRYAMFCPLPGSGPAGDRRCWVQAGGQAP